MTGRGWIVAVVLGAVTCAIDVSALSPTFSFWDTGELQTVAVILGIAHPPACPAFVLAGWVFAHLVPFGEPAWRVGVMCSLAVGVAVALEFLIMRRLGISSLVAAVVSLAFAFSPIVLAQATHVEVQDVSLALRLAAFALALRFYDTGDRRALGAAAIATGLAGATHGIALLLLPSLVALVAARPEGRSRRALGIAASGVAIGLLPYAYLPLRSAWIAGHGLDPTVALGVPVGSSPFWDYDHPSTFANFWRVVTAADFHVASGFAGFLHVTEFGRFAQALVDRTAESYGIAGATLAGLGAALLLGSRRVENVALVAAALLPVPFTLSYSDLQVAERYYLLPLWCGAVAIGIAFEAIVSLFEPTKRGPIRLVALASLALAIGLAVSHRGDVFAQREDRGAETYVALIRELVPDGAIVVADWAYATPLAYDSYVRHEFGHRLVVSASADQYLAKYSRWLRQRPVFDVNFNPRLTLPGFVCTPLLSAGYTVYRITRT